MTLNRMPANFFNETYQSAFLPGTLVPGIEPSKAKLLAKGADEHIKDTHGLTALDLAQ